MDLKYRYFLPNTIALFVFASVLLAPWSSRFTPINDWFSLTLFKGLISSIAKSIGYDSAIIDFSSDSMSLYLLLSLFLTLSLIIAAFTIHKSIANRTRLWMDRIARFCALYFLVLKLASYGLDKCLIRQFYTPTANTLYSAFGMLDRDLLYWSVMGLAPGYSFFLGSMELLCAVLLIIPKTRTIGLLASTITLLQVAAINFGFDISVKLLSSFMLFLSIWLLAPQLSALLRFLMGKEVSKLEASAQHVLFSKPRINRAFNLFVISMIALAASIAHWSYPMRGATNAKLEILDGAYDVSITSSSARDGVKRFFFQRSGHLLIQYSDGSIHSQWIQMEPLKPEFITLEKDGMGALWTYELSEDENTVTLTTNRHDKSSRYVGKRLDWKSLPALRKDFHWAIEDVGK